MRTRQQTSGFTKSKVYSRFHEDPYVLVGESLPFLTQLDRCDDSNPGPGNFSVMHDKCGVATYTYQQGAESVRIVDGPLAQPVGGLSHIPWNECDPEWGDPSTDYLATLAAARTNPSRPTVNVPSFIGELKDLPGAIRDQGEKSFKWARSDSVGVQFGILPMVSDVMKLMNFHDGVARRSDELDRLQSGNGLKRRVRLKSTGKVTTSLGKPGDASAIAVTSTRHSVYATLRWKSAGNFQFPPSGSRERSNYVKRLLLGVTRENDVYASALVAWNLLPWSWMADWFGNVGTYLEANMNQSIASPAEIWVCRSSATVHKVRAYGTSCAHSLVTKSRESGSVSLEASLPIIGPKKMSILGGIGLQKARGNFPRALR
ncbi:MAG: putative maturation protein [Suhnsivirus montiscola]|uniref:Maturation protein n=1 Tax=Leviviridae sp. TaxID=2027243 RepID=A0ABY3SSD1_9VIRU|nr:MAG: putative maturation protein [Leviviridae sp.]